MWSQLSLCVDSTVLQRDEVPCIGHTGRRELLDLIPNSTFLLFPGVKEGHVHSGS